MTALSTKERVLRYIKRNEGKTAGEIYRALGLSDSAVHEAVKRLKEAGIICVKGTGANNGQRLYVVISGDEPSAEYGVNRMVDFFNRRVSQVREGGEHAE
ncbi:MarR family transcriptional regulator [Sodalis sp. dw_96]|uniref:MarR family transcriptional regulator n=1 Tax=Sodalis sp. dw_96 TaxID=2719794 RepID=UPI001BD65727|nr:MarR family transcriptional regulator [Sodalis sp. dw_96]